MTSGRLSSLRLGSLNTSCYRIPSTLVLSQNVFLFLQCHFKKPLIISTGIRLDGISRKKACKAFCNICVRPVTSLGHSFTHLFFYTFTRSLIHSFIYTNSLVLPTIVMRKPLSRVDVLVNRSIECMNGPVECTLPIGKWYTFYNLRSFRPIAVFNAF